MQGEDGWGGGGGWSRGLLLGAVTGPYQNSRLDPIEVLDVGLDGQVEQEVVGHVLM